MPQKQRRSPSQRFGEVSKLPSGNYRVRYIVEGVRHSAPHTFPTKASAQAWLAKTHAAVAGGTWEPPEVVEARKAAELAETVRKRVTLGDYAVRWLKTRTNSKGRTLRQKTIEERERLLRAAGTRNADDPGGPLAELVPLLLGDITAELVRTWYSAQQARGTITQTSRAYELLKAIMTTALADKLINEQPCTIKGGSTAATGIEHAPPTDEEQFVALLDAMPDEYKALVVVGAASGCRYGEATDLRADEVTVVRDVDGAVEHVKLMIDSGVVQVKGRYIEGDPKSGKRTVLIFGEDADLIADHTANMSGRERLFTAASSEGPLPQSTFWRHFNRARITAGMPTCRFHDLRHYAGTRYAQGGATLKETMARLGHSTPAAAMRYQHDANEARLAQLAASAGRKRRASSEG
ncbi:MAG: tyrosine-type recombinase/integrase [Micrococcaceae bacterium]